MADLAQLARDIRRRRALRESPVGIGVAIVGVVRRSDGFVALAPTSAGTTSRSGRDWPTRSKDLLLGVR